MTYNSGWHLPYGWLPVELKVDCQRCVALSINNYFSILLTSYIYLLKHSVLWISLFLSSQVSSTPFLNSSVPVPCLPNSHLPTGDVLPCPSGCISLHLMPFLPSLSLSELFARISLIPPLVPSLLPFCRCLSWVLGANFNFQTSFIINQ